MSKVVVFGVLLVACNVLAGCSEKFQLISYSNTGFNEGGAWHKVDSPRSPADPAEEIAVKVAASGDTIRDGEVTGVYLGRSADRSLVVTMTDIEESTERFDPKTVRYFQVKDDRIYAYSEPVAEPAPDAEFERTVHLAATTVERTGTSVVPYDNFNHPVTLRGKKHGDCLVVVDVMDGYDSGGKLLFSQVEDLCAETKGEFNSR